MGGSHASYDCDHTGWCSPEDQKGYTIQSEITLLDTAPAIARMMGIPVYDEWEGRSADKIFQ